VGDEEIPFHGDLEFFSYLSSSDHELPELVQYRATFSRGRVENIVRVQLPSEP